MSFIVRETAGQVMPNDFYGLDCHDDTVSVEIADQSPGKTGNFAAAQQSEAA